MTWVKLDDLFTENSKVDPLSDGAFRLHVAAICHCSRNLTDGHVVAERVQRLVPRYKRGLVDELVHAGLWELIPGGWVIHDYLDFNPSRAKVMGEREKAAERQRSHRESRDQSRRDNGQTNGVGSAAPSPTRPDGYRSSSSTGLLEHGFDDDGPISVAVWSEIAQRKLAAQKPGAVQNPMPWLNRVRNSSRAELEGRAVDYLERYDLSDGQLVDVLLSPQPPQWLNGCRRIA